MNKEHFTRLLLKQRNGNEFIIKIENGKPYQGIYQVLNYLASKNKMNELVLTAEIVFMEIAKNSFNFPITNSIRLSFWLPKQRVSTFSEIQIDNESIEIGKHTTVRLLLIERDFLINQIEVGTIFEMGVFPNAIATGHVIGINPKENLI